MPGHPPLHAAFPPRGVTVAPEAPSLAAYADVPIAYVVRERLEPVESADPRAGIAFSGFSFDVRRVARPYIKDYDADPASHPLAWPRQFDVRRWGVLVARIDGRRVGGAAVAPSAAELDGPHEPDRLAVLWDIRVAPAARGAGIGALLLRAAERWAVAHGADRLRIETQNVNVPACRFYAARGCVLGAVHRFAYPTLPDELQLLWYRDLHPASRREETR